MQQTSSNYKNEIKQPSRHFECRVTIGKNIYTNESIVDIIFDYPQAIDGFSIGNTTSQSLDLTLLNTGEEIYSTNQIKVEIGLRVGSDFEYILMGYYNVDEVSKNDYTIKFTAFDNMMKFETPYFSSVGDKPTIQQVINELATITGVSFTGNVPSYTVTKLDGYTCREVLSYVASLCGGNALITRDGKFTIKTLQVVDCSVTAENHFGLTTEEVLYKLGKITCVVDSEIEFSKGATGIDSMELSFENPWMTEGILNTLYQQLNGFSYLGFQTKWQGDLALDPYDLILIQDKKGTSHQVPILNQKFTYVGGLTSEIAAKGESKNKNSFSSSGPNANKTNRLVTEQVIIKEALINKANIQDLEAVSIRTQSLEATTAKIQDAIIDVAHISDLNAVNAKIEALQATDVTIQNAIINKADISELNAAVANIDILNADLGVIKHLVNGNLSSENIQAGGITSDKLTIANGFIKDAMIDSLNANKITSGQINTALVQVSSASGNLVINDNTIQIRDANRVRVQIGKDSSNDYSISVWDSSGKLMFDARGLKVDAIKDSIIRDDMISANANIDGSKLNISSVVSSINNGSSNLKASKVQFDGIAQTLEVAFNALKTQADGTKTQTESNTTAINVAQGKINTLIQDTTIVKDGVETKLKDEYSRLEQSVSGLSSTIGQQQTILDDHTGKITSTNSELSTLKQSVNGLSASVSSVQTTIESHSTLIGQKANSVDVYTKAQTDSAINVAKDAINLAVSNTYETKANVETKVNSIQIGGTNLIQGTKDFVLDSNRIKGFNNSGSFTKSTADGFAIMTSKTQSGLTANNILGLYSSFTPCKKGDTFTVSFWMKVTDVNAWDIKKPHIWEVYNSAKSRIEYQDVDISLVNTNKPTVTNGQWVLMTSSHTVSSSDAAYCGIRLALFRNGSIAFKKPKIELGNKATDWSPAPEDISNDITTAKTEAINSAKSTLDSAITNYYTKSQTDSQIKVAKDSITQSVASIYETKANVTSQINGVQSSISTLQTRMSSAESKITEDAITNTVKKNFYTKTETDSQITSKGYQTSSQVQQTVDALQLKFTQSGGYNLFLNSGFKNSWNSWGTHTHNSPTGGQVGTLSGTNQWGFPSTSVNCVQIRLSNQSSIEYGIKQTINTTVGQKYTLSFYYAGHRITQGNVIVRKSGSGSWLANKYMNTFPNGGNGNIQNWTKHSLTFTADGTSHVVNIVITSAGNDGYLWIAQPQVVEGEVELPYSPHPSEMYDGITNIDKDGVKVSTSRGAYTRFGSEGMNSYNNDGNQTLGIKNGGLTMHNQGEYVGFISQSQINSTTINGITIGNAKQGDYIAFGWDDNATDPNAGFSSSHTLSIFKVDHSDSGATKGINLWQNLNMQTWNIKNTGSIYVNNNVRMKNNATLMFDSESSYPSIIWEDTSSGKLCIHGDNTVSIGYRSGSDNKGIFEVTETADSLSCRLHAWEHLNLHGWRVKNGIINNCTFRFDGYDRTTADYASIFKYSSSSRSEMNVEIGNDYVTWFNIQANNYVDGGKYIACFNYQNGTAASNVGIHFYRALNCHGYNITNVGNMSVYSLQSEDMEVSDIRVTSPYAVMSRSGEQTSLAIVKSIDDVTEASGIATLSNKRAEIELPQGLIFTDYYVQVTGNKVANLAVTERHDECFVVETDSEEEIEIFYTIKAFQPKYITRAAVYGELQGEDGTATITYEDACKEQSEQSPSVGSNKILTRFSVHGNSCQSV